MAAESPERIPKRLLSEGPEEDAPPEEREKGEISENTLGSAPTAKRPRLLDRAPESLRRGMQNLFRRGLQGTLKQIKDDSGKPKSEKERQREEIDKRLMDKLAKEKEELSKTIKKERDERKERIAKEEAEAESKRLSIKTQHVQKSRAHLGNFIKTSAGPPIYFLPAKMTPALQKILDEQRQAQTATEQQQDNADMKSASLADQDPDSAATEKGDADITTDAVQTEGGAASLSSNTDASLTCLEPPNNPASAPEPESTAESSATMEVDATGTAGDGGDKRE
ncbi:uncharacterized protein BJ171DRAFT_505506 [Polychytrium aggregatum]|uniref:uncharacterized protein n=1 Tax=Polychytrium aggregatum TaxID=110093 RepID=UPI0022FE3586|nr:uncharacterized protein BJ171DRAFT_505506 [Polychytrium aggregatum]KAI9204329.1 hypothetical protein BJ171DRAFT_505506 [Polychytrium aggregatum]